MGLYVYDTFLADLRNHGDNGFAKRALTKILTGNGSFRIDDDDHRYNGIEDAWIRVISRGNTAWRAIYIRRGNDIYLYRAGEHSIEDNLTAPAESLDFSPIDAAAEQVTSTSAQAWQAPTPAVDNHAGRFRQNHRGKLLRSFMLGRRLIRHKEVILVSPTLTLDTLSSTHSFGMVLDNLIEDGSAITLITRPPASLEDLKPFVDLEARGVKLAFHSQLHAKLYLFEVAENAAEICGETNMPNVAMLGSANLTEEGMGFAAQSFEELCYELPDAAYEHAFEFVLQLIHDSQDLRIVRDKLTKGGRPS